ncbi:MAG: MerR family transcriptional regulator [Actinomycetota bacterium]|nr:MerR family transcriptional regulator [Actinomycetota bacterium]
MCQRTGCTFRQLDSWICTGLVSPTIAANGSGTSRRFDADEVRWIAAVVQMRAAGLRVDAIRHALDRGRVPQLLDGIERHLDDWRRALPSWASVPIVSF